MAEPTLTQVFGSGATQDATTITISKSDLTEIGLTPDANNSAESLLIAEIMGKPQPTPQLLIIETSQFKTGDQIKPKNPKKDQKNKVYTVTCVDRGRIYGKAARDFRSKSWTPSEIELVG